METPSLVAILAMGAVTYVTRIAGWLVFRRIEPGPRLRAWLEHLPGALFAALVAPMALQAGPPGWLGSALAVLVMRRSGQFLLAIGTGLAGYLVARQLLGA